MFISLLNDVLTTNYQRLLNAVQEEISRHLQDSPLSSFFPAGNRPSFVALSSLLFLLASEVSQAPLKVRVRIAASIELLSLGISFHQSLANLPASDRCKTSSSILLLYGDLCYAHSFALAAQESAQVVRGIADLLESYTYAAKRRQAFTCCHLGMQAGKAELKTVKKMFTFAYYFGIVMQFPLSRQRSHFIRKAKLVLSSLPHLPAKTQWLLLFERIGHLTTGDDCYVPFDLSQALPSRR